MSESDVSGVLDSWRRWLSPLMAAESPISDSRPRWMHRHHYFTPDRQDAHRLHCTPPPSTICTQLEALPMARVIVRLFLVSQDSDSSRAVLLPTCPRYTVLVFN